MAKRNSQNGARLPSLPVGNSDWAAVKAGYWSADKTQLISGLLDRKSTVAVFTRPRRFGKTFATNMLQAFFEMMEKSNARGTGVGKMVVERTKDRRRRTSFVFCPPSYVLKQ